MSSRADHAEHEATHVVVGLSLGLPLKLATVQPAVWRNIDILGFTWFGASRMQLAHGITACAGIVWESRPGGYVRGAEGDRRLAREYLRPTTRGGSTRENVATGCRVAAEILRTRQRALARVARELCDRDLRPADLIELVLGG